MVRAGPVGKIRRNILAIDALENATARVDSSGMIRRPSRPKNLSFAAAFGPASTSVRWRPTPAYGTETKCCVALAFEGPLVFGAGNCLLALTNSHDAERKIQYQCRKHECIVKAKRDTSQPASSDPEAKC